MTASPNNGSKLALNVEQERARVCTDNLLVLAPPGSGKTGMLVEKTETIIRDVPDAIVLFVTFTDQSAKEARERLSKRLTPNQMRRVKVSTFHSHAIDQLKRGGVDGRKLWPHESRSMLQSALAEVGSTVDFAEADAIMQAAKSTPDFTGEETDYIAAYEEKKRAHRTIDLQDVIREAVVGMRAKGTPKYIPPIPATHVLCDEFQDVDWNQLYWLFCYFDIGCTITAVGDDDQSVYSFRNALGYDAMVEFVNYLKPTVIHLETNYRSNQEILLAAQSVIRNNAKRMDKVMFSKKGPGGSVTKLRAPNKVAEGRLVSNAILADCIEGDYPANLIPHGRWGILARNNRDLWLISALLRKEQIPFVMSAKKDDAPFEIMTFCGLLVSIQTNDSIGLRNALRAIGVSERSVKLVHDRMGDDFYQILDGEYPGLEDVPIEEKEHLKTFLKLSPLWRRNTEAGQYARVIGAVGAFFLEAVVRGDDSVSDFEDFVELLSGVQRELPGEGRRAPERKIKGNLQQRVENFFRPDDKQNTGGVSLLTLHGSKGLEFDRVFMAQCNAGTIPSAKTKSVDEERRLFFVGMTRARNQLTLSCITAKGPSPFLGEVVIV